MALTSWAGIASAASGATVPVATGDASNDAENLLVNARFASGSGANPDNWRTEAWINAPAATSYGWTRAAGGPGEVEVTNSRPNDARWVQPLVLAPGWYLISTEVRTENVGAAAQGATVSLLEDGVNSPDVRGTSGWRRIGFYMKVGSHGADVEIALRLGGFSSLNTGRAFFRNPSVTRVNAPPAAATATFDLDAIRRASGSPPIGHAATLIAVFVALGALAYYGWRLFGTPVPATAQTRAERVGGTSDEGQGGRVGSGAKGRRGKRGATRVKIRR